MTRRQLMNLLSGLGFGASAAAAAEAHAATTPARADALRLSDADWHRKLDAAQFDVLRNEGTEAPWSSALNGEKRVGRYHCAGCGLPLFASTAKFDSGTGWPSFFAPLDGAVARKPDYKLILPRSEYHCARCGGHQGHVFDDGPRPTGKRYCNNGVALRFMTEGT